MKFSKFIPLREEFINKFSHQLGAEMIKLMQDNKMNEIERLAFSTLVLGEIISIFDRCSELAEMEE